jgi:hypothetical protein
MKLKKMCAKIYGVRVEPDKSIETERERSGCYEDI